MHYNFKYEIVLFQIKNNNFKCNYREKTMLICPQMAPITSFLKNLSRFLIKRETYISSVTEIMEKPILKR